MMNKIVTLSGWGQSYDVLSEVVPDGAINMDYSKFPSIDDFFAKMQNLQVDVIIGWSLGGQLALRLISEEIISPKKLVIISTPYQFISDTDMKYGMSKETFREFYNNFVQDPEKTLKFFLSLISLNDSYCHDILKKLRKVTSMDNLGRWLYWLEELEQFSCNALDFSNIPETFALHGENDTIVDVAQTSLFKSLIGSYKLEVFKNCGHAPHFHNVDSVRSLIHNFIEN